VPSIRCRNNWLPHHKEDFQWETSCSVIAVGRSKSTIADRSCAMESGDHHHWCPQQKIPIRHHGSSQMATAGGRKLHAASESLGRSGVNGESMHVHLSHKVLDSSLPSFRQQAHGRKWFRRHRSSSRVQDQSNSACCGMDLLGN